MARMHGLEGSFRNVEIQWVRDIVRLRKAATGGWRFLDEVERLVKRTSADEDAVLFNTKYLTGNVLIAIALLNNSGQDPSRIISRLARSPWDIYWLLDGISTTLLDGYEKRIDLVSFEPTALMRREG